MQEYQWDSFKIHGSIIPILSYKVRISIEIPRLSHRSTYDEACRAAPLVEQGSEFKTTLFTNRA